MPDEENKFESADPRVIPSRTGQAPEDDRETDGCDGCCGGSCQEEECGKCEEYLAGWKRAQADYANLKKETEREKAEFHKYANERLLESLLPAIDQFEMALAFTPDLSSLADDSREKVQNWVKGVAAVKGLWETAFKDIGLESIRPEQGTEFDPLVHEAVGQVEGEEGKIMQTLLSGWRLNGKLLRPAKVMVGKNQ